MVIMTRHGKTEFASVKWYNLCLQIIQLQTCYPLILTNRIAQQGLRKTRMQERWGNLKEEIWSILQYKDQAEKRAFNRPEVVSALCQ